jgi:hypothetical protein
VVGDSQYASILVTESGLCIGDAIIAFDPIVLQINARRAGGSLPTEGPRRRLEILASGSNQSYMKKGSKKNSQASAATAAPTRRATRVKTAIDVHWGLTEDCTYEGTIINLTVFGCALQNRAGVEVKPGKTVFIRFWMPLERILKVQVVHTSLEDVQGFGARFLDLTEDEVETLDQMIQMFGEPPRYQHE